ncbi:MAG: alpha/beta fold hydrolase [Myxococcota bacterium]
MRTNRDASAAPPRAYRWRRGPCALLALLVLVALTAGGCRFVRLGSDLEALSRFGVLSGTATVPDWQGDPILVAVATRGRDWNAPLVVVAHVTLSEPGYFEFTLPPGEYYLGAVEDRDAGLDVDPDERFVLHASPYRLDAEDWIPGIELTLEEPSSANPQHIQLREGRSFVAGELSSLDHPRFARAEATIGLWRPLHALQRHAVGLFVLEPIDPARTPVVFVHGMGGTARDLAGLIEQLDRERFQPWVFQYPSALPLDAIAQGLTRALHEVHGRVGFSRVCLVAHSMGGLVSRKAIDSLVGRGVPVRGFVSIASPFGGVASAAMGVEVAPAVVPSWRDVDPGSAFLEGLYARPLPDAIPYFLLFAFQPRESSDGVVEIASQLRLEAQLEAERVRGFPATHISVLADARVARPVFELLGRCHGAPDGERVAEADSARR